MNSILTAINSRTLNRANSGENVTLKIFWVGNDETYSLKSNQFTVEHIDGKNQLTNAHGTKIANIDDLSPYIPSWGKVKSVIIKRNKKSFY